MAEFEGFTDEEIESFLDELRPQYVEEERWIPIDNVGDEWEPRSEVKCDDLIAQYARPDHWIHEPQNDDLTYVVGKRREHRYVTRWIRDETRSNAGPVDE